MDINAIAEAITKGAEIFKTIDFIGRKVDELFNANHKGEAEAIAFRMLQQFIATDRFRLDDETRNFIADTLLEFKLAKGEGV